MIHPPKNLERQFVGVVVVVFDPKLITTVAYFPLSCPLPFIVVYELVKATRHKKAPKGRHENKQPETKVICCMSASYPDLSCKHKPDQTPVTRTY